MEIIKGCPKKPRSGMKPETKTIKKDKIGLGTYYLFNYKFIVL